jgi:hypothetical protein
MENSPGMSLYPSHTIECSDVKDAEINKINGITHNKAIINSIELPINWNIFVDTGIRILIVLLELTSRAI